MFDLFDEFGVPSTCTMNAKMGLERRAVIDAALKRGWEILAHNYVQTELLADYSFDEAKEREVIRETLRVYKEVCGKPAKGWLSSSLRCTLNTVDIIAEEGLIFTTDLLNDDQPYLVETRSGKKIVSIPYTSEVNDFTIFMRQGQDVDGGFKVLKEQFDWLYRESAVERALHERRSAPARHRPGVSHSRLARFPCLREGVRRCLVRHPRGNRGVVSEKPPHPYRIEPHCGNAAQQCLWRGPWNDVNICGLALEREISMRFVIGIVRVSARRACRSAARQPRRPRASA